MGWFFGLKLHLVVNDVGDMMHFQVTTGKVDDRIPVLHLLQNLTRKVFGHRGYIRKELCEELLHKGISLITKIKKT